MSSHTVSSALAKPFLRWAGGKRWLVSHESPVLPKSFNRYIEPFLGSGAVFFSTKNITTFILSDINPELINCYQAIKSDHHLVEKILLEHINRHSKEYYYAIREGQSVSPFHQAARFIYLNRACFNGLYRVNSKGKFNVPIGSNLLSFSGENLAEVSRKLGNGMLLNTDFEETIWMAKKGDFIFVDPPYTVNHNLNGFIAYNEKIFRWEDQIRLKNVLLAAYEKGVMITLTNADHISVRELYSDFGEIEILERPSLIAGKSSHRKLTTEIIIRAGWAR
jgi:DNA adenine methylase